MGHAIGAGAILSLSDGGRMEIYGDEPRIYIIDKTNGAH